MALDIQGVDCEPVVGIDRATDAVVLQVDHALDVADLDGVGVAVIGAKVNQVAGHDLGPWAEPVLVLGPKAVAAPARAGLALELGDALDGVELVGDGDPEGVAGRVVAAHAAIVSKADTHPGCFEHVDYRVIVGFDVHHRDVLPRLDVPALGAKVTVETAAVGIYVLDLDPRSIPFPYLTAHGQRHVPGGVDVAAHGVGVQVQNTVDGAYGNYRRGQPGCRGRDPVAGHDVGMLGLPVFTVGIKVAVSPGLDLDAVSGGHGDVDRLVGQGPALHPVVAIVDAHDQVQGKDQVAHHVAVRFGVAHVDAPAGL